MDGAAHDTNLSNKVSPRLPKGFHVAHSRRPSAIHVGRHQRRHLRRRLRRARRGVLLISSSTVDRWSSPCCNEDAG
eukprot:1211394-Prymnesium_polylepis.1